jgi:hypothetical protein
MELGKIQAAPRNFLFELKRDCLGNRPVVSMADELVLEASITCLNALIHLQSLHDPWRASSIARVNTTDSFA